MKKLENFTSVNALRTKLNILEIKGLICNSYGEYNKEKEIHLLSY